MLSTANHPPHRVPDGVKVNPVSYKELPPFITDNRYDILTGSLETYQYAANALGGFVHDMRRGALKRELDRGDRRPQSSHVVRRRLRPSFAWRSDSDLGAREP